MTRDRRELQNWYREAMLSRIDELVDLRPEVEEGSGSASDRLRNIGQALRGSGATFGFPGLSAVAGLVETTTDAQALRRLEGLLVELRRLVGEMRGEADRVFEWLGRCAAPWATPSAADVDEGVQVANMGESLRGIATVEAAWATLARVSGLDDASLAEAVADRFGLAVTALSEPSRGARRLVPEAFMASAGVVPLAEDPRTITVATAHPVSLPVELELERLTGRRPVYAVASPSVIAGVLGTVEGPKADGRGVDGSGVDGSDLDGSGDEAWTDEGSAAATAQPEAVPETRRTQGGPVEVLVVDDEESARLLVRSLLEKRGFATVEASDGLKALEVIRRRDGVALAVVDLNMPRMDGLELLWRLRDAREWAGLPVIIVTGENDEILETQIMEEGADDYIRKPVDPRLFLARVEATLRRAGHASAG